MRLDPVAAANLLRLCDYMESLPPEAAQHFDMRSYVGHRTLGHSHSVPMLPAPQDLMTCGTTACALGWAVTMPEFQAQGMHYFPIIGVTGEHRVFPGLGADIEVDRDEDGIEVKTLWEILFDSDNHDASPREWAARVRPLIHEWSQA